MSTSSWSTIPKELLCMILEERVETRDLLQLQRVCKNWSLVAYQQLYRHIKLNKRKWFLLLAHTLEHSQYQPKFHVKAIEPKYRIYKRTQATELDRLYTLVPLCPNLTHIIIDEEMVSDELYLQLMELHQQRGCLQHLQHLPDYDYHQAPLFRDSYNEAALAMKNTLTRLNIVNAFKHTLITSQHDEAPEIDMLTQLQKFPKLQHLYIMLNNFKMAFQRPAFPAPLALESVRTRPHVENIHIDVAEFNAQDLQYIMHKFPGATKVIIETSGYEDGEAVNRMLADGLLSPQIYLDAFKWLISLKSFEVVRLTLIANVREMLAFWAKRPQIKAITISGNAFVSREGATFSIMNTEGEAEMNETLFEYREKGVWEMWVDLCYIDGFTSIYEQTLEQFKCDSVEHISLYPQLDNHIPLDPLEIEQSEAIGKGFSYVLDHYTAVKEMIIRHARIESFHATTTVHNKAMKRLKFQYCWIEPSVLPQLSCCVSYIERLEFRSVTFLNDDPDDDEDDGVVVIDMPQTSIDEITVHYDIDKEFLVNVYRSHPSISNQATVHYYIIDESKAGEIEQDLYRDLATSEEFRSSHNILEVHCADLKNFIVSTNIINLNIQID